MKADERLREDGLVLGDTQPADAPDAFIVRSQIPAAGLSVDSRQHRARVPQKAAADEEGAGGRGKKKAEAAAAAAAAPARRRSRSRRSTT